MPQYFESFPEITYDNFEVKNILTRVKVSDVAKDFLTNFLPYTIKEGDKPYQVAFDYYTFTLSSDPNKSNWIPIYSYDREDEENEAKLTIKLLDKRFANQAQKNLVALLNE